MGKKKCNKCDAPLEGFLFNTLGKLLGIKESDKTPGLCNKCERESKKPEEKVKATTKERSAVPSEKSEVEPKQKETEEESEAEEEQENVEKSAQQLLNEVE
jgi:hypothetical protein